MFGIKNSAVPYVRIGGVDRQSVLTSNANGNTPVREIGVDNEGNLLYSTDYANYIKVKGIDIKYSAFIPDDDNLMDMWLTENSISMMYQKAVDGDTKIHGVQLTEDGLVMVQQNADSQGNATIAQILAGNGTITLTAMKIENEIQKMSNMDITSDGISIDNNLNLNNSTFKADGDVDVWDSTTGTQLHTKSTTHENAVLVDTGGVAIVSQDLSGTTSEPKVTNIGVNGTTTAIQSRDGNTIRTITLTPTGTKINGNDVATSVELSTKVDKIVQESNNDRVYVAKKDGTQGSTQVDTTLRNNSNIPTGGAVFTELANYMLTSSASITKNLTGTTTITINGATLSLSVSNGTLTIS